MKQSTILTALTGKALSTKKTKWWKKDYWAGVIALSIIVAVISFLNYSPNTWLTGWDNLHPELDFWLNIKRSFSASWQEYQGVGLLGGMSHAADLPRQIVLWGLSIFFPVNWLRYLWTFGMLGLGVIGSYILSLYLMSSSKNKDKPWQYILPAVSAALFYLFNLATVQYFFVPYESFVSFYGFLPWLWLSVLLFFENPTKKQLFYLSLIHLLASPAFYVQTLYVVYAITVLFISIPKIKFGKYDLKKVKNILVILLMMFITSAYWLLPSLYFTVTNSSATVNAKINQLSTTETYLMNQSFGSLKSISLLQGYWFEYTELDQDQQTTVYLMEVWKEHLSSAGVEIIGFALFYLGLIGLIISTYQKKRYPWSLGLLPLLIWVIVMLTSGHGLLGSVFNWFQAYVPLFGQMFRSSFTKWSIPAALLISIGIGQFFWLLLSQYKKIGLFFIFLFLLAIAYFGKPQFQGQLISPTMRLVVPGDYQEIRTCLKNQPPEARIVNLPAHSLWGWHHYDWGYRGSGFAWYGIEQPMLDRTFDVWSQYNETFYTQLRETLEYGSHQEVNSLFQQYQISYALVDDSLLPLNSASQKVENQTTNKLLELGSKVVCKSGSLTLLSLPETKTSFIQSPQNYVFTQGDTLSTRKNVIFDTQPNYLESENSLPFFPFSKLLSERIENPTYDQNHLSISQNISHLTDQPLVLSVPEAFKSDQEKADVLVNIIYDDNLIKINFQQIQIWADTNILGSITPPSIEIPLPSSPNQIHISFQEKDLQILKGEDRWTPIQIDLKKPAKVSIQEILEETPSKFIIEKEFLANFELANDQWQEFQNSHQYKIPEKTQLLSIKVFGPNYDIDLNQTNGSNCDIFKRGNISKRRTPRGWLYEAHESATNCQSLHLPIPNEYDHFVRLKGQNIAGKSLSFYIDNIDSHFVQIENILDHGIFDNTFSLPTHQDSGESYLTLINKSAGTTSLNEIQSVVFYPTPIQQIANITLSEENISNQKHDNTLSIADRQKYLTTIYLAKIRNEDTGVLTLSQGFNKGWIALIIDVDHKQINLAPHFKYNGAFNAWEIPPSTEATILVFFWPQLLSWGGMMAIIAWIMWMLKK